MYCSTPMGEPRIIDQSSQILLIIFSTRNLFLPTGEITNFDNLFVAHIVHDNGAHKSPTYMRYGNISCGFAVTFCFQIRFYTKASFKPLYDSD